MVLLLFQDVFLVDQVTLKIMIIVFILNLLNMLLQLSLLQLKIVLLLVLVLMLKTLVSYLQIGKWLITFLKVVKLGLTENIPLKMLYHNTLKVLPFS
jgi:hypothetical protein